MNLIERVKSAMVGLGTGWVLVLIAVLSIVSVAIMLERAWLYFSLRDDIDALMRDLGRLLRAGDMEGARRRLEASRSAEAAVVVAGLVEADRGVEAAAEAMDGASALQRLKLEKHVAFLGTVGNNAPFIGLLGTVIGIVGAFDQMGKERALAAAGSATASNLAPEGVMINIGEALVATAVGLVIAIPAVAMYNWCTRVVKTTIASTEALSHVLLAHLKAHPLPAGADAALPDGGEAKSAKAERTSKAPSSSRSKASADDEKGEEESN
jgi:biopolymer transport protein ExbB